MKSMVFGMTALLTVLFGCDVGSPDAGFSVTWTLQNEAGVPITCELADAAQVRITIVDSEGATHRFTASCNAGEFETSDWIIATGPGQVSAELVSTGGIVLSSLAPYTFDFDSGTLDNDLNPIIFVVSGVEAPAPELAVTVSWQIVGADGSSVDCGSAGATFVRFNLVDASGVTYELGPAPCESTGILTEVVTPVVAPGEASLDAILLNGDRQAIHTSAQTVTVPEGTGALEIGPVVIEVEPVQVGGDASLTWEWKIGDAYFTAASCEEWGIDYVTLWIWNDTASEWWTDPAFSKMRCDAFDRQTDDAVWGATSYSGLYIEDFLPAGQYNLFLGFYGEGETEDAEDVLLFYDSAGPEEPEKDGVLQSDEALTPPTNHYVTVFEVDEASTFGTVRVTIRWQHPETGELTTCEEAGVVDMGFQLTNEDWVASEMDLGLGYGCENTMLFDGLLITGFPYELLVYGVSAEDALWYGVCTDLVPDAEGTTEPFTYTCDVYFEEAV